MRVASRAESISTDAGAMHVAFDLAGSEARYLLISVPEGAASAAGEFFGHDHYVEVKDQSFGRYGGIEALRIHGGRQLSVRLSDEVPGVGALLEITAHRPLPEALLLHLRRLERR